MVAPFVIVSVLYHCYTCTLMQNAMFCLYCTLSDSEGLSCAYWVPSVGDICRFGGGARVTRDVTCGGYCVAVSRTASEREGTGRRSRLEHLLDLHFL